MYTKLKKPTVNFGKNLLKKSRGFTQKRYYSSPTLNLKTLKKIPNTPQMAIEAMRDEDPETISKMETTPKESSEQFTRLLNFHKNRYPLMTPQFTEHDPLLREHMIRNFGKEASKNKNPNAVKLRSAYKKVDETIPVHIKEMKERGESLENQAKAAHGMRQNTREATRLLMSDTSAKDVLDYAEKIGFGNPLGETLKQMKTRKIKEHGSKEKAEESIIESSTKTNQSVNQALMSPSSTVKPEKTSGNKQVDEIYKYFPEYKPKRDSE